MSKDKRASLSSGLLGSKDAAPLSEDGASSAGSAVVSDAARAEPRTHVLYSKGAASASGFRPSQWSYEDDAKVREVVADRAAEPTPEPKSTITPFPVNPPSPPPPAAPAAPALPQARPQGRKRAVIAVSLAVLLGGVASVLMLGTHRSGDKAGMATAAAPIAPPVVRPTPEAPVPRPTPALPAHDVAELMARGDQLLANGDIVAARGFYERAAEQGSAPASTAVGKTYDPLFLEQMHVRGTRGDAGLAAQWYRKASAAGHAEADLRLKRLIARYAG